MARNASGATPLSDRFSLDAVIIGLSGDLEALRAGLISVEDARVRAEMAKQIMNGVRLVVNAQKFIEQRIEKDVSLPQPETAP